MYNIWKNADVYIWKWFWYQCFSAISNTFCALKKKIIIIIQHNIYFDKCVYSKMLKNIKEWHFFIFNIKGKYVRYSLSIIIKKYLKWFKEKCFLCNWIIPIFAWNVLRLYFGTEPKFVYWFIHSKKYVLKYAMFLILFKKYSFAIIYTKFRFKVF